MHVNIANSKKPLIEEITAAPGSDPAADNQLKRPHYILKENSDRTIIIDIQLNEVKSASDIDLEVSKVSKCALVLLYRLVITKLCAVIENK